MKGADGLLERALSDADPARTPRDASPDARAVAMRDRIVRDSRAPQRRRRRTIGWAAGIAAVAASAAVVFALLVPPGVAEAGTPSPLEFEGSATTAQIIEAAQAALARGAGPSEPQRVARTASWSFSIDMDDGDSLVVPQLSTFVWEPDLSGTVTIVDGVAYEPTDAGAHNGAEVSRSGDVVSVTTLQPGEFATPIAEVPGESRAAVVSMLEALGMPADPTAFDVVTAITSTFGQWTLTDAQHSELLAVLGDAGGAEALGETSDRLGRPVAGMRVTSADGEVGDVVLVSLETGRIVGVERTVLADDGIAPKGAVIDYRMWDVDESLLE